MAKDKLDSNFSNKKREILFFEGWLMSHFDNIQGDTSSLLGGIENEYHRESKSASYGSRFLKWLFPSHTVVLNGVGNFRGMVTKAEWDKDQVFVPSFLISRLSKLGRAELKGQVLLNKYILLSLAASDPGNSKKLVHLSQLHRLRLFLIAVFERTTLYDFLLCASLLHGQSLVVDNEYYHVTIIDLA